MMQPSSHDMLALVAELNLRRISLVYGARQRLAGGRLILSDRQQRSLLAARRLHYRFLRGDYRHSDQECGLVFELCDTLIDWHAQCHNQTPQHPKLEATTMAAKTSCPVNAYQIVMTSQREW